MARQIGTSIWHSFLLIGALALLWLLIEGCSKDDPVAPPVAAPAVPASLKAYLQDSIPWEQYGLPTTAPTLRVRVGDSVLVSTPGVFSRCVVWDSLPPTTVRYVLTFEGWADSATARIDSFPNEHGAHAWATVEEFYGPGNGAYAVLRYVPGECSDTAGSARAPSMRLQAP